jgi:DnaA family protein
MKPLNEQLPLAVQLRDDATFDNFFIAGNSLLIHQLKTQFSAGERYIFIYGNQGSGRSHLLQAACHLTDQQSRQSLYLPLQELKDYPPQDLFDGVEQMDLICLDNIDVVLGDEQWEIALFNLFNRLKEAGTALLVSADCAVRELTIDLADLASRLSWGSVYQLDSLDDFQRQQALQFRAAKRGLDMNDDVVQFIYHRCQRDTDALFSVLDDLDKASLKEQRKLTIPFVKSVLNW